MEQFKTSVIVTNKQLLMIWAMIRVSEIKQSALTFVHRSLKEKVEIARHSSRPAFSTAIPFTEAERKLMRQYNTDYCAVLADKPDCLEAVEIYKMATNIQLLFSKKL